MIRWTHHAERRRREMDLSAALVEEIVREPEVDYSQRDRGAHADRRVAKRGAYAVGYSVEDGATVILTVLHNTQARYDRARSTSVS